jgi:hypothetical protein
MSDGGRLRAYWRLPRCVNAPVGWTRRTPCSSSACGRVPSNEVIAAPRSVDSPPFSIVVTRLPAQHVKMFYSQLLLAKKGPLGKVWLAAHWEKKLNKQAILQTDIKATVGAWRVGIKDAVWTCNGRGGLPGARAPPRRLCLRHLPCVAEQVKKPVSPLSLRVSGHLLLGLSRIFAKKVAYLASDASEVITKIKTVSRAAVARRVPSVMPRRSAHHASRTRVLRRCRRSERAPRRRSSWRTPRAAPTSTCRSCRRT